MRPKESVLEKVRKLFALANDPAASEGEVENALRFAQKLMMKHSIEEGELIASVDDISETQIEDPWKYGESKVWTWQLLSTIARSQNCRIIRGGRAGAYYFKLIGFRDDRALVKESFETIIPLIRNLTKKRYTESGKTIGAIKFTISYQAGFIDGLRVKLEKDRREFLTLAREKKAYELIVVKKEDLITTWIDSEIKGLKNSKFAKLNVDVRAYQNGKADGSESSGTKQLH